MKKSEFIKIIEDILEPTEIEILRLTDIEESIHFGMDNGMVANFTLSMPRDMCDEFDENMRRNKGK